MTFTNICLLAICVCAVWMLEEAAKAEPAPQSGDRQPAGLAPDVEYVPTISQTLLRSRFMPGETDEAETLLAADIQGETPLDEYDEYDRYVPPAGQRSGFGSVMSEGLSGLVMPLQGAGTTQSLGDFSFTESVSARLNVFGNLPDAGISMTAGPLSLDLYAITFAALYADRTGTGVLAADDNGFLAAISLCGALRLELGESTALSLGFTVYYLPTVNRVGVYFSNTGAGLGAGATFSYQTHVGGWDIVVGDRLGTAYPLGELLGDFDVDASAEVDHYRFGRADTLGSRSSFADDIYYSNNAFISASTQLDEYWKFKAGFGRLDFWSTSLTTGYERPAGSRYIAEAGLSYDSPDNWYHPWFRYNYLSFGDLEVQAHSVRAGVTLPFTPTLSAFLSGGWLLYDTGSRSVRSISDTQRYLAEAGVQHEINDSLSHSVLAGHNYAVTDYGDDFLGTYLRYRLSFHPPSTRWRFTCVFQQDENELTQDRSTSYGGNIYYTLTEGTSLRLAGLKTRYTRPGTDHERWLLGAYLTHVFTPTLWGMAGYHCSQYRTTNATANFNEQVLSLSLTKSF